MKRPVAGLKVTGTTGAVLSTDNAAIFLDADGAGPNPAVLIARNSAVPPILRLNREQTKRVFELLDKPPKPTAALLSAKDTHRKLVRA